LTAAPTSVPQLIGALCLNGSSPTCTKCYDVCPAQAIRFAPDDGHTPSLPQLDESACTGCAACIPICPSDAIRHASVKPAEMVRQAIQLTQQGKTALHVACSAADKGDADLTLPCHAAWSPMLLASLAAEGVRTLYPDGLAACSDCPMQHGAAIMEQVEKDYATLNRALGIKLTIVHQRMQAAPPLTHATSTEPKRRAFFRNLLPSITQSAALASAQITLAAQKVNQKSHDKRAATPSLLPVILQLFLRALPKLQSSFTPIPPLPSLPLGAIQADARCTACGTCVAQCPSQALHLKPFGQQMVLEFRADACIGCGRCVHQCSEQALEMLPSIAFPAILTKTARPLVMVSQSDN